MRPARVTPVFGVVACLMACGGDDGPEYVSRPDAPPVEVDAMVPCQAPESFMPGTFAADVQEATDNPAEGTGEDAVPHSIYYLAALNDADPGHMLYIDLYEQFGAFEGGDIKTGTFAIMGDDAAYSTCGACVTIGANVTADGDIGEWYVARSGVLNLTSVTTRLTGTLQNVMLYRVLKDADGFPSDTLTYDCETKIMSASFDTELLAPEPI